MGLVKNFVLDTSVLIHEPRSIFNFEEHNVFIPGDILEDLDRLKTEQTDRGVRARDVIRRLDQVFQDPDLMTKGAKTPGGGRLFIATREETAQNRDALEKMRRQYPDFAKIDNRIIATALIVQSHQSPPTILVTKDINMSLKARSLGLQTNDYLNDKVDDPGIYQSQMTVIDISAHEMQRFASSGFLDIDEAERLENAGLNEYVLLRSSTDKTMPAKCCSHNGHTTLRKLNTPAAINIPGGISLKPLNLGQQCFLDALFDPDISLITGYGKAGTGKTLVAVAAGLSQVYRRSYQKLIVTRSVVPMGSGETLGFLPGDLNEKMRPWLQPIYDAIEFIMSPPPNLDGRKKAVRKKPELPLVPAGKPGAPLKPHEKLIEQGVIEIEALYHIRGRSIPNAFFIVDEAQQLSPLEAKTIVTRMSKGSKLVLLGDPTQIDNPYVDAMSNGLVYTRNKLKGQAVAAHIQLAKGERSILADLGAELM
ncbi:PhoH family protein [Oscillatoria laete-virens NRMC-F 0139]|nr:PhoH family protein [Oscillatoria laete-virens]MDL5054760.1 PhoH family protein [Oscillatoria laete-virens NRMC-F 0139]